MNRRRITEIARLIGERLDGLELPGDIGLAIVLSVPDAVGDPLHQLMTLTPGQLDRKLCYRAIEVVAEQQKRGVSPLELSIGGPPRPRGQA